MFASAIESMKEWARGRTWWTRAPVVLACAWLGVKLTADCDASTIFGAIDLGIHEAGHVIFRFGGEVVCAFGGSLLQCLAPLLPHEGLRGSDHVHGHHRIAGEVDLLVLHTRHEHRIGRGPSATLASTSRI